MLKSSKFKRRSWLGFFLKQCRESISVEPWGQHTKGIVFFAFEPADSAQLQMGYIQVYVGWSYDTKKKKPASPPPSISKNSWTSPWTVSCKTSGVTPLSLKLEEVCIWIKIQLGMAAVVPVVSKPSNEQSVLHDSQVPKMIGLHGRCIKLHHIELDLNIYNRYKYIYI